MSKRLPLIGASFVRNASQRTRIWIQRIKWDIYAWSAWSRMRTTWPDPIRILTQGDDGWEGKMAFVVSRYQLFCSERLRLGDKACLHKTLDSGFKVFFFPFVEWFTLQSSSTVKNLGDCRKNPHLNNYQQDMIISIFVRLLFLFEEINIK